MRFLVILSIACLLLTGLPALAEVRPVADASFQTNSPVGPDAIPAEDGSGFIASWDWALDTLTRGGKEYTRAYIPQGGVQPGESGEERPFYQLTLEVRGEVTKLEVCFLDPVPLGADTVPALAPQWVGSGQEALDPRWTGKTPEPIAEWELIRTSDLWIGGARGAMYSLRLYPMGCSDTGETFGYTAGMVTYETEPSPLSAARAGAGHKPAGDVKYLIITHDTLKDAVMPLADWKSQKGLIAEVVTTSQLNAMYGGTDTALKMRKYVMKMELQYDLEYLLIVGDWNKVPTRKTRNSYYQGTMGEPDTFASDLYFACVDNGTTWNSDGDIYYAEDPELDDAIPDMAVGRLAINNATQLAEVVADLIQREKNLTWDQNADVAVYIAGDPGALPGDPTTVMDHFWTTYGSGTYTGRQTMYYDNSSTLDFNSSNFKRVVDDRHQVMNYYAHGECDAIPGLFNNSQISTLAENGSDGSMFSMACLTGWFDDPNQGSGMGAVENCFGEMLTETPRKGLVGYIGASRIAVGEIDTTYSADAPGLQEDYCRAAQKAHQGTLEPTVGKVWQDSVTHFSNSFHPFTAQMWDNPGLRTFLEYNLLGEPDAPLMLRPPEQLNLTFVVAGDHASVWARVVNATGANVTGATVCLYRYGELGVTGTTNATGEVDLLIPANNGGIINITASRAGDRPDSDTFTLPDNLAPLPVHSINPASPDGDAGRYVSIPTLTLGGDEPCEVEYRWDGGLSHFNQTQAMVQAPEGNHTLEFRVKDTIGLTSSWVDVNVHVDTTPPGLQIGTDPAAPDGDNGYFVSLPNVTLTADEPLSKAEYRIDDGYFREYKGFVVMKEGQGSILFRAFDIAGNQNSINMTFQIDLTPPITILNVSHSPQGRNGYYVDLPTIEVVCTYDPTVSLEYRWDEGAWQPYSAPLVPEEGAHTLYYRGTDLGGNKEAGNNKTFLVDTNEPALNLTIDPAQPDGSAGFYTKSPTVLLSTNEGARRYALKDVSEPGFNWTDRAQVEANTVVWTGPIKVSDGTWRLYTASVDEAGNLGYLDPMIIKVDTTNPAFGWRIDPAQPDGQNGWYVSEPSITLQNLEEGAVAYWAPYGEDNWSLLEGEIDLDQSGQTRLQFRVVDRAGNVAMDQTGIIKIDLLTPTVNITTPLEDGVYGGMVEIGWSGADGHSGLESFERKVDGGQWQKMGNKTGTVIYDLTTGGHFISIRCFDAAGNEGAATVSFTVDATAPAVASASPTGSDVPVGAKVEVTFSKEMDHSSVRILLEGVPGNLSWDGSKAVFTPAGPLDHITTYNASVEGVDIYGNRLEAYEWSFTTELPPDADDDGPEESTDMTMLIIAVVAIAALIIAVLVVILVLRSRKKEGLEAGGTDEEGEDYGEEDEDDEYEDDEYLDDDYEDEEE